MYMRGHRQVKFMLKQGVNFQIKNRADVVSCAHQQTNERKLLKAKLLNDYERQSSSQIWSWTARQHSGILSGFESMYLFLVFFQRSYEDKLREAQIIQLRINFCASNTHGQINSKTKTFSQFVCYSRASLRIFLVPAKAHLISFQIEIRLYSFPGSRPYK